MHRVATHRPASSSRAPRSFAARIVPLCAAALVALGPQETRAQTCVPEDCLPPAGSAYSGSIAHHFSFFGTTVDLANLALRNFSSCSSPPASVPSATATSSFNALMDFTASVNGAGAVPGTSNAQATIMVRFNHQTGSTRYFDTEMLQLDLSGPSLPLGAMIRESPTMPSVGQTTIQSLGGGNYAIDSFFDIFFEISLDGGQNWAPESSGPGRLALNGPGCPTPARRNTWGSVKIGYR
jgi:hypothetical protein